MSPPIPQVASALEDRGLLVRSRIDHSSRIVDYVRAKLSGRLPPALEAFYRERIEKIGAFWTVGPVWNDHVGWRPVSVDVTDLLHASAVPICFDGCGNLFGLDLRQDDEEPAVYFFDHEEGFAQPVYAAGSSLGSFMLLLAETDQALDEGWPDKWELSIDPDLEHCPRAPAIWNLNLPS